MSETNLCRERLAPYCKGQGLDIGFGGSSIAPHAINFDLPQPYTNVGGDPQHLFGDAMSLPFKDKTMDFIFSSHLIEDFTYEEQRDKLIREWMRVLRRNGRIVLYAPDEQIYRAHCEKTGQPYNHGHKNSDYSLKSFKEKVLDGYWITDIQIIHEADHVDVYSWEMVLRKLT